MFRRPIVGWATLWLAILIAAASPAHAGITAFWQQVTITPAAIANDPALASMQCWDLMVTTSGNWAEAGLRATLSSGIFYNHPFGGATRPSNSLIQAFPALGFDTYVTAPGYNGPPEPAPNIFGGFPGNEPFSMSGAVLSVAWGDTINQAPGMDPIARATFPLGVIPDILTIDQNPEFSRTSQLDPDATTAIPEIPEPSGLGVMIGVVLFARHRRSHEVRALPQKRMVIDVCASNKCFSIESRPTRGKMHPSFQKPNGGPDVRAT